MPFEPGVSGNPNGPPKREKQFRFALIRAFKDKFGDDAKGMAKVAEALIDEATIGDNRTQAIKEIRDTIDGKPAQSIIGDDENPIRIEHSLAVSDQDIINRFLQQTKADK